MNKYGEDRLGFGRWTDRVGTDPDLKDAAMSIVVRFTPANLTAEKYDESHPKVEAGRLPARRPRLPRLLRSGPDNLMVSEIWDSREQFEAWGEKLMPILTEAGIEFSGEPEVFEVHNIEKR